jgi:hypothetical protein
MPADLFTARDAAALLAIRKSLDEGRLSGDALRAAFSAAGLLREQDETGSLPIRAPVDARADGPPTRAA